MQERAKAEQQSKGKTRHLGQGVAAGGRALGRGFWSGIKGLVTQPIKGAKAGGAKGFFKGIGRGFIGAITKPLTGTLDMVSNTLLGVSRTAHIFGPDRRIKRVRNPRYIGRDGVLTRFNVREAQGVALMKAIQRSPGDYIFHAHIHDVGEKCTCICAYTGLNGVVKVVFFDIGAQYICLKLSGPTLDNLVLRLAGSTDRRYDDTLVAVVESEYTQRTFVEELKKVKTCSDSKSRQNMRWDLVRQDAKRRGVEWLSEGSDSAWDLALPRYSTSEMEREQQRIMQKIKTSNVQHVEVINFSRRVERKRALVKYFFFVFEIKVVSEFGVWLICRRHNECKRLTIKLKDSELKNCLPRVYVVWDRN